MTSSVLLLIAILAADPLTPGDHTRRLKIDQQERSYTIHVPPKFDAEKPAAIVLVFHGAAMNGRMMVTFTGLNDKADEAGFIAVYPDGTGVGPLLTWNTWGPVKKPVEGTAKRGPDDVAFVGKLLDDLGAQVKIDARRVYATGMSNGGMMCYRLAAELSDRIAAIAPVAGTMTEDKINPKRPVSVIHFHGAKDQLVPFQGPGGNVPSFITFKSVDRTIRAWADADGCPKEPKIQDEPDTADDGTRVERKNYGPGKEGAEVVLFVIDGGGHTWPGSKFAPEFLGKTTRDISANDLMWDFFQRHPLK